MQLPAMLVTSVEVVEGKMFLTKYRDVSDRFAN